MQLQNKAKKINTTKFRNQKIFYIISMKPQFIEYFFYIILIKTLDVKNLSIENIFPADKYRCECRISKIF